MPISPAPQGLQLRSLVKPEGVLELSLVDVPTPAPAADEVVVRIEATPINPSDIGLLFGAADLGTVKLSGTAGNPVIAAQIPERAMKLFHYSNTYLSLLFVAIAADVLVRAA